MLKKINSLKLGFISILLIITMLLSACALGGTSGNGPDDALGSSDAPGDSTDSGTSSGSQDDDNQGDNSQGDNTSGGSQDDSQGDNSQDNNSDDNDQSDGTQNENQGGNDQGDNTQGDTSQDTVTDKFLQAVPENLTIGGEKIPSFSGKGYHEVNNNTPFFTDEDKSFTGYLYSELDSLGRCGAAIARLTKSLLPSDGRESISSIYPSGWKYNGTSNNNTYPTVMGQNTIYNRSHLIAHELISDDAHKRNLITGTMYMNQTNMTDFESLVADYVKGGYGDVLYRVTPLFEGDNLVASGVLMEAYSLDDNGESVSFCVFLYNVQPGIEINYLTGENKLPVSDGGDEDEGQAEELTSLPEENVEYILKASTGTAVMYFGGNVTSKKTLDTVNDPASASGIFFEKTETEGVYYIYTTDGSTKSYITMTSNATRAFSFVQSKGEATTWKIDLSAKQIVNTSFSTRAISLYSETNDLRTYALTNNSIWVWIAEK